MIAEMQWLELALELMKKKCQKVASSVVLGLREEGLWVKW